MGALVLVSCGGATSDGIPSTSTSSALTAAVSSTSTSTPVLPTTVAVAPTTTRRGLRGADAPVPTGDCAGFEIRSSVFVVLGPTTQAVTADTCTQVAPSQTLLLVNPTSETISVIIGARSFTVPPLDRDYPVAGRAGDLLAPGVHRLGDRDFWLVDEPTVRLPDAAIALGSYGPLTLGMTAREVQRLLGADLAIDPQYRGWDGHPLTLRPLTMPPFATASLSTYDASVPAFTLRARGADPLDAELVWISPGAGAGQVPAAVEVGWTPEQVRAVYGTRLVTPSGATCPRPDSTILAVYDGAPVTGSRRLWFVFVDGLLANASTSTVDLVDIGRLGC